MEFLFKASSSGSWASAARHATAAAWRFPAASATYGSAHSSSRSPGRPRASRSRALSSRHRPCPGRVPHQGPGVRANQRAGLDARRPAHRSTSAAASAATRLSGDGPANRAFSRSPVAHPHDVTPAQLLGGTERLPRPRLRPLGVAREVVTLLEPQEDARARGVGRRAHGTARAPCRSSRRARPRDRWRRGRQIPSESCVAGRDGVGDLVAVDLAVEVPGPAVRGPPEDHEADVPEPLVPQRRLLGRRREVDGRLEEPHGLLSSPELVVGA